MKKFLFRIWNWILGLFRKPEPPEEKPLPVPDYIEEMKKSHPGLSVEEFRKGRYVKALVDTHFRVPQVLKNGEIYRNTNKDIVTVKMKNTDPIRAGQKVFVYKYAFTVDSEGMHGNAARESVYHPDSERKGLIDIKDFSKPEE